jgi:hypothetical protein
MAEHRLQATPGWRLGGLSHIIGPACALCVIQECAEKPHMQTAERQFRKSEVARTGRIPVGTDVHHRHLRNPSIAYLRRVIRQTEALISSGECHADWGRKRTEALQKMLKAKESRLEKKRASK